MTTWRPGHSAALLAAPVVALNFHDIPARVRGEAARALRQVARVGPTLDPDAPPADGPRVFVAFYDSYREAGLFGAEECHRLGLRAVFFPVFSPPWPGVKILTETELRDIASVHELGFHTANHAHAPEVDAHNVVTEVHEPLRLLTDLGGTLPRLGAWQGGTRFDPTLLGNRALVEAGVRHLVSNWSVERLPRAQG